MIENKNNTDAPDSLPSEWMPIATAPRDGSVFLTFVPHSQRGFVFAGVITTDGRLICMMSGDDFSRSATEWMPMVPFPETKRP